MPFFAFLLLFLAVCSLDPPPLDSGSSTTAATTEAATATAGPGATTDAAATTVTAGPSSCELCPPAALAVELVEDEPTITTEQAPYLTASFTMDAPGQVELLATGTVLLADPIGPDAVALEYHLEIDDQPVPGTSRALLFAPPGATITTIATHGIAEVDAGEHSVALVAQGVLGVGSTIHWRQARALTVRRWE